MYTEIDYHTTLSVHEKNYINVLTTTIFTHEVMHLRSSVPTMNNLLSSLCKKQLWIKIYRSSGRCAIKREHSKRVRAWMCLMGDMVLPVYMKPQGCLS